MMGCMKLIWELICHAYMSHSRLSFYWSKLWNINDIKNVSYTCILQLRMSFYREYYCLLVVSHYVLVCCFWHFAWIRPNSQMQTVSLRI